VVLKPAEEASLSVLRITELLVEAGVPDGVVNIVTGFGSTAGAALAAHPDVDRIAFTGSTSTGRKIVEASAGNLKRLHLELGGKSPDIVFADADLERAAKGATMGTMNNSGQICFSGTRVFVERSIEQEFVERMVGVASALRIGNGMDEQSQIGPLISAKQLGTVSKYVELGLEQGATLATGGTRVGGDLAEGYYYTPTIFSGATNEMRVAREEIFGPVICVIPFDTPEEALRLANDTEYGLGGGVWSRDFNTVMQMVRGIQAGAVWVNNYGVIDPSVGFGGTKLSGYGIKGGPDHIGTFLTQTNAYIQMD
jgi:aldehyde dehydrogenase (NAD+)